MLQRSTEPKKDRAKQMVWSQGKGTRTGHIGTSCFLLLLVESYILKTVKVNSLMNHFTINHPAHLDFFKLIFSIPMYPQPDLVISLDTCCCILTVKRYTTPCPANTVKESTQPNIIREQHEWNDGIIWLGRQSSLNGCTCDHSAGLMHRYIVGVHRRFCRSLIFKFIQLSCVMR